VADYDRVWGPAVQLYAVRSRHNWGMGEFSDLRTIVELATGAEAWHHQDRYAFGASVGAPPDDFNLYGQHWGLPP
jgi:(1->4)-alpha-D-glucan 1-alpha-D-glucosylmutase